MPPSLHAVARPLACTLAALAALAGAGPVGAQTISFPDFSSTAGLQLNGDAAAVGNRLVLTPATFNQGGSAFSTTTVTLNANASFSTFFAFEILGRGGLGNGADGLTFTVQPNANNVGGIGGGLGYVGIGNSVAVEFDTFDNSEFGGSNHVGVDLNGSVNSVVSTPEIGPDFDDAAPWYAWVDYDGATDNLEVRWAQTAVRPVGAMLAHTVDLTTVLGTPNVFVGFTAGTGAGFGEHAILSWSFVNDFVPGGAPPPSVVPEPGTWALLATGLVGVLAAARRRREG